MDIQEETVLVAVADNEVQALVYRKILHERGIAVSFYDDADAPVEEEMKLGRSLRNIKVVTWARDAETAKEIIKSYEDGKITKVISKSGEHLFFKCPQCGKYLWFDSGLKGSPQICTHCLKIVQLPR